MLRRDPSLFTAAGETHFYQDLNRYRRQFADLDDPGVFRDFVYLIVALAYLGTKRANQRDDYSLATFNLTDEQFDALVAVVQGRVPPPCPHLSATRPCLAWSWTS
jgi:hypothetical protein